MSATRSARRRGAPAARPLAPLDPLARRIQRALDLIKPHDNHPPYDGYCGVATKAYLHLSGERPPVLCPHRLQHRGAVHWWLVHETRGVIDVTLSSAERRAGEDYPYERGQRSAFRNGYARPSKRAQVLIDLVRAMG